MKKMLAWVLLMCATPSIAQDSGVTLEGNWKYLRNFTYINVDADNRIFQCRITPDLNVFLSTGTIGAAGEFDWEAVRFFSLYGHEVSPSGRDWGHSVIELRGRIMFLEGPDASGQTIERREFDRVAELPTICAHYLELASD